MAMTKKQKDEIIKLYAEFIEIEDAPKMRQEHLITLRDTFGQMIPDWKSCLGWYAEENQLIHVQVAIAEYDCKSVKKIEPLPLPVDEPTPTQAERVVRLTKYGYSSRTEEEIEADLKAFNERRVDYALMMHIFDRMYHEQIITLEDYYLLQEKAGDLYGFPKNSVLWWNGPHELIPIGTAQKRKVSKPYTKRNTEYWSKFEKKKDNEGE